MTTLTSRFRRVAGAFVIALLGSLGVALALTTYDDFADGVVNPFLWIAGASGGSALVETSGALVTTIPANALGQGFTISSQIGSRCQLRGDFDVMVNFALNQWPADNGVRVALGVLGTNGGNPAFAIVERASLGPAEFPGSPREVYAMHSTGSIVLTGGTDLSGVLRLARSGSTITASVWSNLQWVVVGADSSGPTSDVQFVVNTFTEDAVFSSQLVQVSYDDVTIAAGTLVNCPVDTIATMGRGDDYTFTINRSGKKAFPLWLISTPAFDATQINPATVQFGAYGGPQYVPEKSNVGDVNGDGRKDLKLLFKDVFVNCSTRLVVLTGQTFAGASFGAFATVTTVGCQS